MPETLSSFDPRVQREAPRPGGTRGFSRSRPPRSPSPTWVPRRARRSVTSGRLRRIRPPPRPSRPPGPRPWTPPLAPAAPPLAPPVLTTPLTPRPRPHRPNVLPPPLPPTPASTLAAQAADQRAGARKDAGVPRVRVQRARACGVLQGKDGRMLPATTSFHSINEGSRCVG